MRRSILAARTEIAINRIAAETARLGGEFERPRIRGDVEHQQLAFLESLALALEKIGAADAPAPDDSTEGVETPEVESTDAADAPAVEAKTVKTTKKKGL
jgi:hypothetical protein